MKIDMDKIILENREEISLLQNVAEKAIESGKCNADEKKIAKRLSEILDSMWYSW